MKKYVDGRVDVQSERVDQLVERLAATDRNLTAEHDRVEQLNDRLTKLENVGALEAAVHAQPGGTLYSEAEVDLLLDNERKEVTKRLLTALENAIIPKLGHARDVQTLREWIVRAYARYTKP